MPKLLEVNDLRLEFGGVKAIDRVSFEVEEHQVVGLIGPNGAGKTSVFNCITGFYRPSSGSIKLDGTPIAGKRPYQISRIGVRRTFQNIRLFGDLSVAANILAGAYAIRTTREASLSRLHLLCSQLRIDGDFLSRTSSQLPFGFQRRVELARALIGEPRLLLADEPGAGLNEAEKVLIVSLLREAAHARAMGVVLIDHDIGMIAQACDRVIVLDRGLVISAGEPKEVQRDQNVISAYLGS